VLPEFSPEESIYAAAQAGFTAGRARAVFNATQKFLQGTV